MNILERLFGTSSAKEIKKITPIITQILGLEDSISKLSDLELQQKTLEFKNRLHNGETLDDILPESFAVCREASSRILGMKHFPVQLIGGIVLHQGKIAEMRTGEGKTLVATLPAYLNALSDETVFVVTVNDYLAKRDSQWMGKLYSFLGLTTGLIIHETSLEDRKKEYGCNIVYGTNNEIGFDYLRDNMAYSLEAQMQRNLSFAIVDEVDSILIDEARTPLIISGAEDGSLEGYQKADDFVKGLKGKTIVELESGTTLEQASAQMLGKEVKEAYSEYDYIVEEKKKSVMLTEKGVEKAEKFYGLVNLADSDNIEINHYITRSLKANGVFKKDRDYVIKDDKIIIVDESTGRLMDGRRYSEGVHQAIEAKEKVEIQKESKTLASITFQNLFRKFDKLSGMTGTAKTEEEEFRGIYALEVVEIPPNKPVVRIDKPDKVYIKKEAKLQSIVRTVKSCYEKGQPVLVGTASVEHSEELAKLIQNENIPYKILNAKYHEQEAYIVSQAGRLGAVTIATNMAGRGTDIILGGNSEYWALEELRTKGFSEDLIVEANSHSVTEEEEILNIRKLYSEIEKTFKVEFQKEAEKVKELGGLFIIGSERHESRRIDNQLRGRAGRQGDVGVSEFVLSLEDDLLRIFGSNKLVEMCKVLNIPDEIPIDLGILSNNIEKAQRRIESNYYAIRKQVLEYDNVIATQRDIVYSERQTILESSDLKEKVIKIMNSVIESRVLSIGNLKNISLEKYLEIQDKFLNNESLMFKTYSELELNDKSSLDLITEIKSQVNDKFEFLCKTSNESFVNNFARKLFLFLLDNSWQDHMVDAEELKKSVGFNALSQKDPKEVFKFETFEMFDAMNNYIKEEIFDTFMGVYSSVVNENK